MKKTFIPVMLAALMLAASCNKSETEKTEASTETTSKDLAEDQNDKKFDDTNLEDDAQFAVKAAEGGLYEVKLANLAQEKAVSPAVKELADHIAKDHEKANTELKALALKKNITLPDRLSDKCQKDYDDLAKENGIEFDKKYAKLMVQDHKDDIDKFKTESEKGKDADISAWALDKIPTLQHHLEKAESAEKAVKDDIKAAN